MFQQTGVRPPVLFFELGDLSSVRRAAARFAQAYPRLDVLVNSAGHSYLSRERTAEGLDASFGVNVLGPFLLTSLLEPLLRRSFDGRIDLDDLYFEQRGFDTWKVANTTQQARVMLMRERAHRLPPNVTINAVHPGAALTQAQAALPWHLKLLIHTVLRPGFVKPDAGAVPVVRLATDPALKGVSGRFYRRLQLQPIHYDPVDTAALWTRCHDLVDLPHLLVGNATDQGESTVLRA